MRTESVRFVDNVGKPLHRMSSECQASRACAQVCAWRVRWRDRVRRACVRACMRARLRERAPLRVGVRPCVRACALRACLRLGARALPRARVRKGIPGFVVFFGFLGNALNMTAFFHYLLKIGLRYTTLTYALESAA